MWLITLQLLASHSGHFKFVMHFAHALFPLELKPINYGWSDQVYNPDVPLGDCSTSTNKSVKFDSTVSPLENQSISVL